MSVISSTASRCFLPMQCAIGYIVISILWISIRRALYGCEIRSGVNLHIGKGSIIGDNCILDARQGIYIGKNANLSSEVHLWTEAHDVNDPYFRSMPCNHGPIHIGDRAWLGSNVTVLDNVSIGEGAVVCSGAVVTKDVEPYAIVAGIPAKKIGERSKDLRYEFTGGHTLFY